MQNLADPATSVIQDGLEIVGDVNTSAALVVRGKIQGNVRAAAVTIEQNAEIQGDVESLTVTVQGTVAGQVRAKSLQLDSTATVLGDLAYDKLKIEPGADFQGLSKRLSTDENPLTQELFQRSL